MARLPRIRRLNGACSSRQTAPAQARELRQRNNRNTASTALGLHAQPRLPETEFLDTETGRRKSPLRLSDTCRDQNPRNQRPKIPAETPYLASAEKRTVYEDWMVVCAVRCEPVSIANTLLSGNLSGNFAKFCAFALNRPGIETARQALIGEFPKKANRDFFRSNREFRSTNREF
jgi:hypothetical protein